MSTIYRRDFLKGLTLTSAALMLPAVFALEKNDSPTKINHLIGLGSASFQVFLTLQGQPQLHKMTVIDTEIPEEKNHHIALYPLKDQDMQQDALSAIFNGLFKRDDNYFIVASLGGHTGNDLFVSLAEWMEAHQKNYRFTALLPFHFEGQSAMFRSNEALSHVQHDNLGIIELENFRKKYGHIPLQSAMEHAHHHVLSLWELDWMNDS